MRHSLLISLLLILVVLSSCKKNGNNSPMVKDESTSSISNTPTPRIDMENYIGQWALPISNQITQKIQLFFDPNNGVYYTKEIETGKAKTDSLVVVITKKKGNVYAVEYANLTRDNYEISNTESVIWRCPGYDNVTCKGFINLEKLASTFEQYRSTPSTKPKWEEIKSLSNTEKNTFYDWSKQYVKMSLINSESLIFPDISKVKVFSKQNGYRIEYSVSGKNLYNESVLYPISIVFAKEGNGELTFGSISTE